MTNLTIVGAITLIAGVVISALHRHIGSGFCKLGKAAHGLAPEAARLDEETLAQCYPEDKMPRNILIAGITAIVVACMLIAADLYMKGNP